MIRYEHRLFLTGATRTGKSTLARGLFLEAAAPRMVIDPHDTALTVIKGAVTFSDPARATNDRGERWTTAATARFVPDDPGDLDAYDQLYRWAFAHYPRYVWLDEAAEAMPANNCPRGAHRYVAQGAKRALGHLACHSRPREVARSLIAQAQHLFIFDLPNPDDHAHLAAAAGIPPATLSGHLAALPRFGFLWWNQLERELTICPPLRKPGTD